MVGQVGTMISKYNPRMQRHKTRAIGGRESGGVIGNKIIKQIIKQINITQCKIYIFNKQFNTIGYIICAPINNNINNSYDFYSTGQNIIQWISNQICGVKIHLAAYY